MIGVLPAFNPYADPAASRAPPPREMPGLSDEDLMGLPPVDTPAPPPAITLSDDQLMGLPPVDEPFRAALQNPAVRGALGFASDVLPNVERARENFKEAFRQGPTAGIAASVAQANPAANVAALVSKAIEDVETKGVSVMPQFRGKSLEELHAIRDNLLNKSIHQQLDNADRQQAERDTRRQFDEMAPADTLAGKAAATSGYIAGMVADPLNVVGPAGAVGRNLATRAATSGAIQGTFNAGVEGVLEGMKEARGVEDAKAENVFMAGGLGFLVGAGLPLTGAAAKAATRWVQDRFKKAPSALTPDEQAVARAAVEEGDPDLDALLKSAGTAPENFSSPEAAQAAAERIQRRRDLDSQGRTDLQGDDVPRFREPPIVTEPDARTTRAAQDEVARRMELERAAEAGDVDPSNVPRPAQRPDAPIYVDGEGGAVPPGTRMDELDAVRQATGRQEAGARREVQDAFDVAAARRQRYEGAVTTEARTDTPQPRQDMAAGGRPEGAGRQEILMVGDTPVQMAGRTADGRIIVDPYDPRTGEPIPDGRPFVVQPKDIATRQWSPTERMAQDFEARAVEPRRGVGAENPGPRQATDRMGSRQPAGLRGDTLPPDPRPADAGPSRPDGPTIDGAARRMYEDPAYDRPAGPAEPPRPRLGVDAERLDYERRSAAGPVVDDAPPAFEPRAEVNGVELRADAGDLTDDVRDIRALGAKKKLPDDLKMPYSLSEFVAARGGIRENASYAGDVRSLGALTARGEKGGKVGVINNKTGRDIDDITLAAWEDGYFPGHAERPTPDVLIEALRADMSGARRYSFKDEDAVRRIQGLRDLGDELDTAVPGWRKMKAPQISERLAEARSFEDAARLADDIAADFEADLARLTREAEEFLASRGDAWEPDAFVRRNTEEFDLNARARSEGPAQQRDPGGASAAQRPEVPRSPEGRGARGAGEGEGSPGRPGDSPRPVRTEALDTVDGPREQGILPDAGFERSATGGPAAKAGADAPMRGRAPQKDPGSDGGLFDEGTGKQPDMLDSAPRRPASPDDGFTLGALGDWGKIARTMKGMTDPVADVIGRGLGKLYDLSFAKDLFGGAIKGGTRSLWDFGRTAWLSNDTILRGLAKKYQAPTLDKIADLFHSRAGRDDATTRTFHEAVHSRSTQNVRRAMDLMGDLVGDEKAERAIRDLIVNPKRNTGKTRIEQIAAEIGRLLKDELEYRRDAGEAIGEVKGGYFPRILDDKKLAADETGFKAAAARLYRNAGVDAADARMKADALFDKVIMHGHGVDSLDLGFQVNPTAVARTAKEERVFGAEADAVLADFYNDNVFDTLVAYFNGSARSAEYARRFGVKGRENSPERIAWEKENGKGTTQLEVMEKAIRKEILASGQDATGAMGEVAKVLSSNLGTMGANTSRKARATISGLHTWNILATMDRSLFTSISELGMLGMRTGSVRAQIKGMGEALREYTRAVRGAEPSEARRWAESLGLVNDAIVETMLQSRVSGLSDTRLTSKINSGFFKATTLHQWTEGTRVAAVTAGREFLSALAHDIEKGGRKGQRAGFYLKELGVQDPKAFAGWMKGESYAPDTATVLKDKGQAATYSTALVRFANQTIMNPSRAEKPRWASHPFGSLFYGLLSFSYSFQKNVLARQANLIKKAVGEGDPSHIAGLAIGLPVMLAITYAIQEHVRPVIFGKSPRAKEEGPVETALKVIDRAGFTGILSPVINAVTGLKYERDLATAGLGPALGSMAEGAGSVLGLLPKALGGKNADNTDTAEHKAIRTAYRLVVDPVLDAMSIGLAGGAARSAGVYATGHRRDEDAFVGFVSDQMGLSRPGEKAGRGGREGRRERSGRKERGER